MQLFHHLSEERRLLLQDWGKIYWFLALDSRANTVSRYRVRFDAMFPITAGEPGVSSKRCVSVKLPRSNSVNIVLHLLFLVYLEEFVDDLEHLRHFFLYSMWLLSLSAQIKIEKAITLACFAKGGYLVGVILQDL